MENFDRPTKLLTNPRNRRPAIAHPHPDMSRQQQLLDGSQQQARSVTIHDVGSMNFGFQC